MDIITALNPNSILDIGVGFGKYGVLCREYLELWDGREDYHKFIRRIDGIEAFKNYLTPLHDFIYNNVYVGDALHLVDKLKHNYDLVLVIDVLEHLNKSEGKVLINKLLKEHKSVLIVVPKNIGDQKESFNNPYEMHKGQWKKGELRQLGHSFFVQDTLSYIVYIGKKDKLKDLRKKYYLKKIRMFLVSVPLVVPFYYFIKGRYPEFLRFLDN